MKIYTKNIYINKLGAVKIIQKDEWNDYYRIIEVIDTKQPTPSGTPVEAYIFVDSNWAGNTQNRTSTFEK